MAVRDAVTTYEAIRKGFGSAVPFAALAGITIVEVGAGLGIARLEERPEAHNHIGSMHAGAVFTLGETASAVAMLGLFAMHITSIRPLTVEVAISYLKIAKGALVATARVVEPAEQLQDRLSGEGRATFDLAVDIADDRGAAVAQMTAKWTVSVSKSGRGWMSAFDPWGLISPPLLYRGAITDGDSSPSPNIRDEVVRSGKPGFSGAASCFRVGNSPSALSHR